MGTWVSLIIEEWGGGGAEGGCSHKPHTEHHVILHTPLRLFSITQYFPECYSQIVSPVSLSKVGPSDFKVLYLYFTNPLGLHWSFLKYQKDVPLADS